MRRIASRPPRRGMRRSISTRSGASSRTRAIPSSPSPASATTSKGGEPVLEREFDGRSALFDLTREVMDLFEAMNVAPHPGAERLARLRAGPKVEDGVADAAGRVLDGLLDLRPGAAGGVHLRCREG